MSNIKLIELKGKLPGKNLVILAGVHGNEICGVKAFEELIPKLELISGKVTFIYANLKAIKESKRFIEMNLNRCFLEKQSSEMKDTLEGKTAREIMIYLDKSDAVLDIHASFTKDSMPFVICGENQVDLSRIFNVNLISFNWDKFEPGSTDYYMNLQSKPGICIECGYLEDLKSIEIAKKAIISFLTYYKCISGKVSKRKNQEFLRIESIYKNSNESFKRSREFKDFEIIRTRTLIGFDGNKKVYANRNDVMLFVRDRNIKGEECFLIGRYLI